MMQQMSDNNQISRLLIIIIDKDNVQLRLLLSSNQNSLKLNKDIYVLLIFIFYSPNKIYMKTPNVSIVRVTIFFSGSNNKSKS